MLVRAIKRRRADRPLDELTLREARQVLRVAEILSMQLSCDARNRRRNEKKIRKWHPGLGTYVAEGDVPSYLKITAERCAATGMHGLARWGLHPEPGRCQAWIYERQLNQYRPCGMHVRPNQTYCHMHAAITQS